MKCKYEEQLINKMEEFYNNDRNEFWKLLKSMKVKIANDELMI